MGDVPGRKVQSKISRWLIALAIFGGLCNLACWVLTAHEHFYVRHEAADWSFNFIFVGAVSLAPLLVLIVLRHRLPIVGIYTPVLFLILVWRASLPSSIGRKFDEPALALLLFGLISMAVLLVWATICLVAFVLRRLNSHRSAS